MALCQLGCRTDGRLEGSPPIGSRLGGKRETKCSALAGPRFHPDPSPVLLHDPFTNRQPDPGAWNILAVQTLEDAKNAFCVVRVNTHAIVFDRHYAVLSLLLCRYVNLRCFPRFSVLDR